MCFVLHLIGSVHVTAIGGEASKKGGKGKLGKAPASMPPTASAAAIKANPLVGNDGEDAEGMKTVIGVGVDMDSGTMWWRVSSDDTLQPFGPVPTSGGVFPAVGLSASSSACDEPAKLAVNLGRHPFTFAAPDGYYPVEDVR
jgi:hypothetical protein